MKELAPPEDQPSLISKPVAAQRFRRIVQIIAGLGLATFLLGWALPWLTHTSWPSIIENLSQVGWRTALWLLVLMFGGLWVYTFTIAASLPRMKHVPALIVNLCGSGVSNSMPGGGAVGAAAQYAIFRSWGFNHRDIGSSLIITSVWNLLIRMILPIVAVIWLILGTDQDLPALVVRGALIGGAAGLVLAGLLVAVLASERSAHAIGHALNRIVRPLLRVLRRDTDYDIEAVAVDIRERIIGVVRPNWPMLTFGVVGFLGIYFVLFRETMTAFGIQMTWGEAFACYAFSRMLTMVPLTPGGIGITEIAAVLMVAFGADGTAAAAAVFLFAIYSHLLEIPFGALAAGAWVATRSRYRVAETP